MFKIILPKLRLNIEKWKWNKEYRVYVSTLGHIKNEYKQNLPIKINPKGYCVVKTHCGYKLIHRLVLLTFKPVPNAEELTVDHLNHNKRNNTIDNLEWVTRKENLQRAKNDYLSSLNIQDSNKNIVIISGKNKFSSLDDCVEWVLKNNKYGNIPNKKNIKRRIYKAINENTLYCKRKWKMKIVNI